MKSRIRPRILLLGAGKYGEQHLLEWQEIAAAGVVELAGVVVASEATRKRLHAHLGIPVHTDLDPELLANVDGVDIVTPSRTHFTLARSCLPYTNVLVEKPVAMEPDEIADLTRQAKRYGHVLMAAHVFRYHPVVKKLQELVASANEAPILIEGQFTNPLSEYDRSLDINLEFLHYFDVIDFVFGIQPRVQDGTRIGSINRVHLQYAGKINADLRLGWTGTSRVREFDVLFPSQRISCNFSDSIVTVQSEHHIDKFLLPPKLVALNTELRNFVDAITAKRRTYPDGPTAKRVVEIARASRPGQRNVPRPRIAVLGGGLFGVTCAAELSRNYEVALFERHDEFMTEASYLNQWRHHAGFHYARSDSTIAQINASRDDFSEIYGAAVVENVASYFCTAKTAEIITRERYLEACRSHKLQFKIKYPPLGTLDRNTVSLSLLTNEGVYDIDRMREIARARLQLSKNIEVRLNTEVTHARLERDGRKRITFRQAGSTTHDVFDCVVNTTYVGRNLLHHWLGFPKVPLRFDLMEAPVFAVPLNRISVTVLDAPFCSMVSNGVDGLFSLSHIHGSVLRSAVTADGLPPKWGKPQSNWRNILREVQKFIPALRHAEYVGSRIGLRTVFAFTNDGRLEDFDGRPTVISDHGFGCYSILAGKLITCVTNARSIRDAIDARVMCE